MGPTPHTNHPDFSWIFYEDVSFEQCFTVRRVLLEEVDDVLVWCEENGIHCRLLDVREWWRPLLLYTYCVRFRRRYGCFPSVPPATIH